MTTGQTVNLCGSAVALLGSLSFVVVYSAVAPWWRSRVGRLLVSKALAIVGFMTVSISAYVIDPSASGHIGPLLITRGALAGGFGLAMAYQAWLVCYTQIKKTAPAGGEVVRHVHGSPDA